MKGSLQARALCISFTVLAQISEIEFPTSKPSIRYPFPSFCAARIGEFTCSCNENSEVQTFFLLLFICIM